MVRSAGRRSRAWPGAWAGKNACLMVVVLLLLLLILGAARWLRGEGAVLQCLAWWCFGWWHRHIRGDACGDHQRRTKPASSLFERCILCRPNCAVYGEWVDPAPMRGKG